MRTAKALLAAAFVFALPHFASADVTPDAIIRTDTVIHKDASFILHTAYPTAKDVLGQQGNWYETTSGYVLDEKMNYTDSDGDSQSFTLRFTLDHGGHIASMTELTRTELWPTFATSNLLLAALQSSAQSQVDDARLNNRTPPAAATLVLKAKSIEDVVTGILDLNR